MAGGELQISLNNPQRYDSVVNLDKTPGGTKKTTAKKKATPITGTATGVKSVAAPKNAKLATPAKTKPSYADASYWDELNGLLKNASNYKSNKALQESRVKEDYATQLRNMQTQRGRDLPAIENDFAGRGIVRSGLYGKRVGEYEQDYQNSLASLQTAQARQLQDISSAYTNYLDQWRAQKQAAIKSAIQRKLANQKK